LDLINIDTVHGQAILHCFVNGLSVYPMIYQGFIMFHSYLIMQDGLSIYIHRRRAHEQVLMDRVAKLMTLLQTLRETFVKALLELGTGNQRNPFSQKIKPLPETMVW
jgi:hypothetical protein